MAVQMNRHYVTLFSDLNGGDMNAVVTYLTDNGVTDYRITENNTIQVPDCLLYTSGLPDRTDWSGTVNLKVNAVAGSASNLNALASAIETSWDQLVGNGVTNIGQPETLEIHVPFQDTTSPQFTSGHPTFQAGDSSVRMSLLLSRPGTVYYVVAPLGDCLLYTSFPAEADRFHQIEGPEDHVVLEDLGDRVGAVGGVGGKVAPQPRVRNVGGLFVDAGPGLGQGLHGDVGGQEPGVPRRGVGAEELLEVDREGIGLLAAGAAGAPDCQGLVLLMPLGQFRQNAALQEGEMLFFPHKIGRCV